MGCSHCMNNTTPHGEHMDFGTFMNVIDFQKKYGGPICFITGGEPFEHPEFWRFIWYAMSELPMTLITIATNGVAMADPKNTKLILQACEEKHLISFQVSTDSRYYPTRIDTSLPVYHLKNVTLITKIPKIYPQGRAKTNNLDWQAIGSKCFNVRAITKQLPNPSLSDIVIALFAHNRICTPHIDIYGGIKLGESDLCPTCSSIYKRDEEIVQDILSFKCSKCKHVNANLRKEMRTLIGED